MSKKVAEAQEVEDLGIAGITGQPGTLTGQHMFEQTFKKIDDVLWKEAGCTTELDYTEQASWMLFLKYLDDLQQGRATEAEPTGKSYDVLVEDADLRFSCSNDRTGVPKGFAQRVILL